MAAPPFDSTAGSVKFCIVKAVTGSKGAPEDDVTDVMGDCPFSFRISPWKNTNEVLYYWRVDFGRKWLLKPKSEMGVKLEVFRVSKL